MNRCLLHPLIGFLRWLRPLTLGALAWALQATALQAADTPATASGGATAAQAGVVHKVDRVQVQEGDMASVLAFAHKPPGSTIEQMMVALLHHNPEAFSQGNVNLLRAGAVLRLPPAQEVLRISPEQAREMVQRHHSRGLAPLEAWTTQGGVPATAQAPAASAPAPASSTAEREALLEQLRIAKAQFDALQKNIQELERLTQAEQAPPAWPAASEPQTSAPEPAPVSVAQPRLASGGAGLPLSWVWLAVAAIVAVMVGVAVSPRLRRQPPAAQAALPSDAAAQFQANLQALDLNLPPSPHPTTPPRGPLR